MSDDKSAPVEFIRDFDEPGNVVGKHETGTTEPIRTLDPIPGISTIDPFTVTGTGTAPGTTGTGPRKRGRPPGSRNKSTVTDSGNSGSGNGSAPTGTTQTLPQDITFNLEELIFGIHQMLGEMVAPELECDHTEAKDGAKHIKAISSLYNHNFNPATLVWLAFLSWMVTMYATRGVAIYRRVTAEKPALAAPGPQIVPGKPDAKKPGPTPIKIENPSQLWNETPVEDGF